MAQQWRISLSMEEMWVPSWVRKFPWRRAWQPSPVFLPGKSHGQRSLVGYSAWGCKESDTTEWLSTRAEMSRLFFFANKEGTEVVPGIPRQTKTADAEARSRVRSRGKEILQNAWLPFRHTELLLGACSVLSCREAMVRPSYLVRYP